MGSSRARASKVEFLVKKGFFSLKVRCVIRSRFSDMVLLFQSGVVE